MTDARGGAIGDDSRPVLLFGAGGFAAEVFDIAAVRGGLRIVGCVVDVEGGAGGHGPAGLPIHRFADIADQGGSYAALSAIGTPQRRPFVEAAEARGFHFLTLVHPSAQIAPSAVIGAGCVIGAGAVIAAGARLGRHVLLNRGTLIGHHARLGDFASCGPGANIGGHATIGAETAVAIGAVVVDRVTIGARATIGAGAVVTKSFGDGAALQGSPARPTPQRGESQ